MATLPRRPSMQTRIGTPSPLGATWDGDGVNFAVTAPTATAVELALFEDRTPTAGERTFPMYHGRGGVWHLRVEDLGPGQALGKV